MHLSSQVNCRREPDELLFTPTQQIMNPFDNML